MALRHRTSWKQRNLIEAAILLDEAHFLISGKASDSSKDKVVGQNFLGSTVIGAAEDSILLKAGVSPLLKSHMAFVTIVTIVIEKLLCAKSKCKS